MTVHYKYLKINCIEEFMFVQKLKYAVICRPVSIVYAVRIKDNFYGVSPYAG